MLFYENWYFLYLHLTPFRSDPFLQSNDNPTQEGGKNAGIHARDAQGRFFTILESPVYEDESTGLAFSPDGMHLYVAYQRNGVLLDVWRKDEKPFTTKTLNIKYHNTGVTYVE